MADDPAGPVALVRQERLTTVGLDDLLFPPTFAGDGYKKTGYVVDELSDGTLSVLVDSVGSQTNRMESLFVERTGGVLADLVPQISIEIERKSGEGETLKDLVSVMEAGHRLGDALIRASELAEEARSAFLAFLDKQDAGPIAMLSPTTLVFGAWDSRDTQAKLPRIVQSTVRAWGVDVLKRSAQYTPPIDYAKYEVFKDAEVEAAVAAASGGGSKNPLAQRGYVPVPATDSHGGVRVNGEVLRDIVVNMTALRGLDSPDNDELRRYVLGLSVMAAATPLDSFYRQGCLLVPDAAHPAPWQLVLRDGTRKEVELDLEVVRKFTTQAAGAFVGKGEERIVAFDRKRAQADSKKKK